MKVFGNKEISQLTEYSDMYVVWGWGYMIEIWMREDGTWFVG